MEKAYYTNIRSAKDLRTIQSLLESKIEQKEEILAFQFKVLKSAYSPRNILNDIVDELSDTFPMIDMAIKGFEIASAIIHQLRR